MRVSRGFRLSTGLFAVVLLVALSVGAAPAIAATSTGPAQWSATAPPDGGSTALVRPTLTVQAYDPAGLLSSPYYSMKVDGKAQTPTFAYKAIPGGYDRTRATLSFVPRADLAKGNHTVYVSVLSSAQKWSTYTWTFAVSNAPKLAEATPASGSTVTTDHPVISARVTQGAVGIVQHVIVDGAEIPSGYDSVNQLVSATPVNKLLNDASHDVTVTVTNSSGNTASLSWTFSVQIYASMPVTSVCADCHQSSSHPMNNCDACHGPGSPVGEGWSTPDYGAHSWTYVTNCSSCHVESGGYPTVPALHSYTNDTYHVSTGTCSPCHVKSLPTEHYRYGKTCATCHNSTDPKVQMAISMGQTDCMACHANADHESLHQIPADVCTDCHGGTSLTTIHLTQEGLTCATCHKSTDPQVVNAIATHDKECSACHVVHSLEASFCYGCHVTTMGTYNGKAVAQTTDHLSLTSSTRALTVYPGSGAPAASCVNCHPTHTATPRAAGNALCYSCHDDTSVVHPADYSYQGSAGYQAAPHGGSVTNDLTNSVLRADSAGFAAYESVAPPTPTNPGTPVSAARIEALMSADGSRVVTALSNVTGGTDYQVYRFKLPSDVANVSQLVARWSGFGEETAGYPVSISLWNKTQAGGVGAWEQVFSGDTAEQASVKATESTAGPYADSNGYVWMMATAKNVRDADVVLAPAAGGNTSSTVNVSWTTLGPCDSWVDYGPTTSYGSTAGSSARSTAHNVTLAIPGPGIYHYRARSVSRDGDSYTSTDKVIGAPSAALVPVPDDYNTIGSRTVSLRWSEPLAANGPFTYQVLVRDAYSGAALWSGSFAGATSTVVTLDAGSYSWDVTATDRNGISYGTSYPDTFTFWYPGASCPTLYTWDGTGYVFQTDVMTRGFLGLQLGNKTRYPIASEDTVIDSTKLVSSNGSLKISLKDDNDEIEFVDAVSLKAVDHPTGTQVVLNDLNPYSFTPTTAPETIHTLRNVRPVVSASYDCLPLYRGQAVSDQDVTSLVTGADGAFAPAQLYDDNRYTFDLGDLGANPAAIKFVVTGWTQYPTTGERNAYKASASQSAQRVLEVQNPDGSWRALDGGLPVLPGYKKTAVFDLTGQFPEGTTSYKIRLRGWFRTYVDFAGVDTSVDEPVTVTQLDADSSALSYAGISRFTLDGAGGYPSYDYAQVLPITRTHDGHFTKYGDVGPLTSVADNKFVIMDSGDELKLSFPDGGLPAAGQTRTYLIHADGYHQTLTGTTEPLPFLEMSNYPYPATESYPTDAEHTQYRQEWNTRERVSGFASLDVANPIVLASAAADVFTNGLDSVGQLLAALVAPNYRGHPSGQRRGCVRAADASPRRLDSPFTQYRLRVYRVPL